MIQETISVVGPLETVQERLKQAGAPMKVTELIKGLAKPPKTKATDFARDLQIRLDEEVRGGRLFSQPSGPKGQVRYWHRDEKQLLCERALVLAEVPQSLATLKTKLGKEIKGTAPAFVEAVLRELIGSDQLFEHPPKTKKGGPLFGARPAPAPVPVLQQPRHRKQIDKLVQSCRKLLTAAAVGSDALLELLRARLTEVSADQPVIARTVGGALVPVESPVEPFAPSAAIQGYQTPPESAQEPVDDLIFKAVTHAPVVDLAELRSEMPVEYRGRVFDEAVLRLIDQQKVVASQDVDPARFTPEQRAGYVQDGPILFTTLTRRTGE